MIDNIIDALLFFLPGAIGNVTPILINKVPLINTWSTPLDFGKTFRGQRIFGQNKRWRGLIIGTLAGGLTGILLEKLVPHLSPFSSPEQALVAGLAIGGGALLGDAIESFFKRQVGVKPGDSWFPFDQTDYIAGGLLIGFFVLPVSFEMIMWVFILFFVIHLVASYCGYLLGFKEKPI